MSYGLITPLLADEFTGPGAPLDENPVARALPPVMDSALLVMPLGV
jgi:hypothetical protein